MTEPINSYLKQLSFQSVRNRFDIIHAIRDKVSSGTNVGAQRRHGIGIEALGGWIGGWIGCC